MECRMHVFMLCLAGQTAASGLDQRIHLDSETVLRPVYSDTTQLDVELS